MKVLIQVPPNRGRSVATGWLRAIDRAGFEWRALTARVFDDFDEFEPDIFIKAVEGDRAVAKCLAERPHVMVIDQTTPAYGFDHLGLRPGKFDERLACDAVLVGHYKPEKADLFERYLGPVLESGLSVRIFGLGDWPHPQHVGLLGEDTLPDAYASAKVCLDISRKPVSERYYQICGCGGLPVSLRHTIAGPLDGLSMSSSRMQEDFVERVVRWCEGSAETRDAALMGLDKDVMAACTYAHRLADLFRGVGLRREADQILRKCFPAED